MPPSEPTPGSWEFYAHRSGDRVRIEVTAASDQGEP